MTGTRHPIRRRLVALVALVGMALGAAAGLAVPANADENVPNPKYDPTVYWWEAPRQVPIAPQ